MFNEDKTVAAAQKVMLEILTEIHKICVANDITYWLEAGTLLGAIRHKGFIPWDDDCDIAMPREDYNRFIKIAPQLLPKNMFLQTKDTDPEYIIGITKVRKLGTTLIETGETGEENYCHGIFVDIFIQDCYESKGFIDLMHWSSVFRDKKKKYPKGSLKRKLVTFYTNFIMAIPVSIAVAIRKYYTKHPEKFQNKESKYMSYALAETDVRATRRENIFPVKLVENVFEGRSFYMPKNEKAHISVQFGADFMTLPPVERRKTHAQKIVL